MDSPLHHSTEPLSIAIKSEKTDINENKGSSELSLSVSVEVEEYMPWLKDNITNLEPQFDWSVDNMKNDNEMALTIDVMDKKPNVPYTIPNEEFECKICSKTFRIYKHWNEHINTVHSTLSLPCEKCHKTFRTHKYLRQHNLRIHNPLKSLNNKQQDITRLKCFQCNAAFKHKANLHIHMKTVHCTKDQAVTCELCNSQLKNNNYLNAHKLRVHYDDGKKHFCDVCGKSYKSPRYLRVHKNNIHVLINGKYYLKSNLKACQCGCRNYFLTEEDLQNHLRSNNLLKIVNVLSHKIEENIQVKMEVGAKDCDVVDVD